MSATEGLIERLKAATMGFDWADLPDDAAIPAVPLLREAAAELEALRSRCERMEEALNRQCDNVAFLLNRAEIPPQWWEKFDRELTEDRALAGDLPAESMRRDLISRGIDGDIVTLLRVARPDLDGRQKSIIHCQILDALAAAPAARALQQGGKAE